MPYKEVLGVISESDPLPRLSVIPQSNEVQLPIASPSITSHRLKILLFEGNPNLRDFIQLLLSEFYDIVTAQNGKETFGSLKLNTEEWALKDGQSGRASSLHRAPSLIISDNMMPVMDGLEVLEAIKK